MIGAASGIGLAPAETILSYAAKKAVLADINDANLDRKQAARRRDGPLKRASTSGRSAS